jgi:putative endonuclease
MKKKYYYVYFLQSSINNRYYIGTSDNVVKRLNQHNSGLSKSTAPYRPWKVIKIEKFDSIESAYQRERFIKKKKSRKIIEKIINSDD